MRVRCIKQPKVPYWIVNAPEIGDVATVSEVTLIDNGDSMETGYLLAEFPLPASYAWRASYFEEIPDISVDQLIEDALNKVKEYEPCLM